MANFNSDKESLFGGSVDDYLLFDGILLSEKQTHELDDKYVVEIEVPGFKPEQLELIAQDDTLKLRGFEITKVRKFLFTQITKIPVFQRSLIMPIDTAPNTVSAYYDLGTVKIICPKQMIPFDHNKKHYLVQKRKIKIQSKNSRGGLQNFFKK